MVSTNSKDVMPHDQPPRPLEEQLSELFGSYKAEWLREKLYELFKEPKYFPELLTARPCVLEGGRGTGKTSVLRCLSHEGQFALAGRIPDAIRLATFYGFYYRVDTNRVTAFKGPELSEAQWVKHFGHYFNLLTCGLVLNFIAWYELHTGTPVPIAGQACEEIAASLNLPACKELRAISDQLRLARLQFEAYINNVADGDRPLLSLQGAPVERLLEALSRLDDFRGKPFFFLVDEYENFEDYQQQVINTLIKHSGSLYSFKIGVRELGWRIRATLNENEQLISPSDYIRINIADHLTPGEFSAFAREVCNERIARVTLATPTPQIETLLPSISEEQEAESLGIQEITAPILSEANSELSPPERESLAAMSPLFVYFLSTRRAAQKGSFVDMFRDSVKNAEEWNSNFNNYKHALLFTIRRRKRGIHKYYAGWDTFVHMAAGNIRYLLELVVQSLLLKLRQDGDLSSPVTPDLQTTSAQSVGKKNLSELEGLSVHGAQLTKLVLGLGRIFQVMAADALGHTPEVNQFHISPTPHIEDEERQAGRLLEAAVMHLALLRSPGNKLTDYASTREYDYFIHPVYSAFFEFSYRRKRKLQLTVQQLLRLVSEPREAIKDILAANNRIGDEPLPEQALLFSSFYGAS